MTAIIRLARVAEVHTEDNAVDIVLTHNGARQAGVQVAGPDASTKYGTLNLPKVGVPASGNKWSLTEETENDMTAVVAEIGGRSVVLGFLYPQKNQMLFKDKERKIARHQSDFYETIDGKGNKEWVHPNGTYFRIGEGTARESLEKKNEDKSFETKRNTDSKVSFTVGMGGNKAMLSFAPDGTLTINTEGKVNLKAKGEVSIETEKAIAVKAPGGINIDTPKVKVTGDIEVDGDVKAGGVSLRNHKTKGVRAGPDLSDVPLDEGGSSAPSAPGGSEPGVPDV